MIAAYLPGPLGYPDTEAQGSFYRMVDSSAMVLQRTCHGNQPALRDSILSLVYRSRKIGFDPTDTSTQTFLPHCVYRERKGACLGVSLIILILAEKTGCPIHGVMLPDHFFCRYEDGKERLNIEPNRSGTSHDDAYYRSRYDVKDMPWYDLANLSSPQVIGVLCYNAGTVCLQRRQYGLAIAFFREATRRLPSYGEAKGNMAVAFAKKGAMDSALVLFDQLWTAYPSMPHLATNYGLVASAAKRPRVALQVYITALERDPGDRAMFDRAARLAAGLGSDDSSLELKKRYAALLSKMEKTGRGGR